MKVTLDTSLFSQPVTLFDTAAPENTSAVARFLEPSLKLTTDNGAVFFQQGETTSRYLPVTFVVFVVLVALAVVVIKRYA